MKKIIMLFLLTILLINNNQSVVYAEDVTEDVSYVVYDELGEYLFERPDVRVDDIYITKDFKEYRVYLVDELTHTAKAQFVRKIPRPQLKRQEFYKVKDIKTNKKISLYMTHNDESYTPSDGYDSIYGPGGIHDVARELKRSLEAEGISVTLNETLHIPHNSSAYSRSQVTAKELLSDNPDALFDIHRDGVSRMYYDTVDENNQPRSKVRIVVGQRNPNKEINLQFALYLMSVADIECPWLFADIYYASGNYNQDLYSKALLFEMGTYLIEKEAVLKTVPRLADVINTTLYNTSVDEEGGLVVGGAGDDNVNDALNVKNTLSAGELTVIILVIISSLGIVLSLIIYFNRKDINI